MEKTSTKRNLYGRKMFVLDLMLVSVWALYFSRHCSPGLLLAIPVRIALSFEMLRKSPWTLVSAIAFMIIYLCADCFSAPFEKMLYDFFCAVGESDMMVRIYSKPFEGEMMAWFVPISILWFLWLAVLPIADGVCLHNMDRIRWKNKWIWIYLVPLVALSVWVMFQEGIVGGILLGLFIAALPMAYWSIYERHGRSAVQLLMNDRNVRWYLLYGVLMMAVVTIGTMNASSLKIAGLLAFPPLFYIMLTRSLRLGDALTRCCVALSVSGFMYWLSLDTVETVTIILLCAAVALVLFAALAMAFKTKTWKAPLTLMVAVPVVVAPFTLGLNPYVVVDAEQTHMNASRFYAGNGLYVVGKYVEKHDADGVISSVGMKYGLRDRYGLILPMEYSELKPVGRRRRYVMTNSPILYGNMISDRRYGIFDLYKRKWVIDPRQMNVVEVKILDDNTLSLTSPEGMRFATLYLPGVYDGEYQPEPRVEPCRADTDSIH